LLASSACFCAAQTGAPPPPPVQTPPTVQTAPPVSASPDSAGTPPAPAVPDPTPVKKPDTPQESRVTPPPSPATAKSLYVIGPLDVLYIRVWNNANLTGMVNVQDDGMISMPLIGQVKADGLTVEQLRQLIDTRLDEYIQHPDVSVDVTKNNSKKYYIIGGSSHPGPFPLNGKLTISEALAIAGGFKDFANKKKIYLLRGAKKFPYNDKEVSEGKHLEQDIEIESGDKIYIPE